MAKIIDGKGVAKTILSNLKPKLDKTVVAPRLDIILANNREDSQIYISNKIKACDKIGMTSVLHKVHTTDDAVRLIQSLNDEPECSGIIVQLPVYENMNKEMVLSAICPEKDVDGFGKLSKFTPCTAKGVIRLLETLNIPLKGLDAVVVGCSKTVGLPIAMELLTKECTVQICHEYTKNLKEKTKQADLLISATGCVGLITKEHVKAGAIVIDVGISKNSEGKVVGDVESGVKEVAGYLTPVPKGVGPMTVAMLLENVWEAYCQLTC